MLNDIENNFAQIEKNILKLTKNYRKLQEEYAELSGKYQNVKQKYEEARNHIEVLQEEQKRVKLKAAISGNPDHSRLMKNHINRLVKEIDACIDQLQNHEI